MGRSVSRLWWRRKLLVCASSNPQATLWVVLLLAAIVAGWHQYGREKVRVACTGLRRARSYFKYLRSDATKIGALIRTCFLSPCHAKYLLYLHQSYVHEPQISLGCVLPFALFHIFLGEGPLTRRCGFEAMHCVLHDWACISNCLVASERALALALLLFDNVPRDDSQFHYIKEPRGDQRLWSVPVHSALSNFVGFSIKFMPVTFNMYSSCGVNLIIG